MFHHQKGALHPTVMVRSHANYLASHRQLWIHPINGFPESLYQFSFHPNSAWIRLQLVQNMDGLNTLYKYFVKCQDLNVFYFWGEKVLTMNDPPSPTFFSSFKPVSMLTSMLAWLQNTRWKCVFIADSPANYKIPRQNCFEMYLQRRPQITSGE